MNDDISLHEGLTNVLVHDQVDISLTIAEIGILQTIPLIRQHLQRFGEQYQFLDVDGDLIGPCLEDQTLEAYDVTDIIGFEPLILLCSDII